MLAGLFLGTLAMLNILGLTRFLALGHIGSWPIVVAIGALPYPITFLCTDLISEIWGEERAAQVVWVGLLLNGWVVLILWLGACFRAEELQTTLFEIQRLAFDVLAHGGLSHRAVCRCAHVPFLETIQPWTGPLAAQQRLHPGQSTGGHQCRGADQSLRRRCASREARRAGGAAAAFFLASGYLFKVVAALADTLPFIWITRGLRQWLNIPTPAVKSAAMTIRSCRR